MNCISSKKEIRMIDHLSDNNYFPDDLKYKIF